MLLWIVDDLIEFAIFPICIRVQYLVQVPGTSTRLYRKLRSLSTEECTFSVIQKAYSPKNDFFTMYKTRIPFPMTYVAL